ncbi:MAG: hypothetical protein KJ732_06915 [Candidatus Margulisbacteria bacterium]|nr:hypothetical protein [Candidatus Margulisiibacteriota bacterium]
MAKLLPGYQLMRSSKQHAVRRKAELSVGQTMLASPLVVAQKEYREGENAISGTKILEQKEPEDIAVFLDLLLGTIYNLSRQGLFISDWVNLNNVIIPLYKIGKNTPALVFTDPFRCVFTRDDLE